MTARAVALSAAVFSVLACGQRPATDAKPPAARHLQIDGTLFRAPGGSVFQWRGITAFRLLDYIADKREPEVERYLAWAASQGLTVVRVLAMGGGFMDLRPRRRPRGASALARDGRAARPSMSRSSPLPGRATCLSTSKNTSTSSGGLPGHTATPCSNWPTSRSIRRRTPRVHDPDVLRALAARVPAGVPVALGSIETGEGFAAGDYVTWHVPRDDRFEGWGHVLAIASGDRLPPDAGTSRSSVTSRSAQDRGTSPDAATICPPASGRRVC